MFDFVSRYLLTHLWKQDEPDCKEPTVYRPEYGFEDRPHDRQPITISTSTEDMNAARIEDLIRDECVYYKIRYRECLHYNVPFFLKCEGLAREITHCKKESLINSMKEFERERRLNKRERLLAEMAN